MARGRNTGEHAMNDSEIEPVAESRSIGTKIPVSLYDKCVIIANRHGYNSLSELMRDGLRRLVLSYESYSHKQITDMLIASGKITVTDLMEAIYAMQKKGIE